MVSHRIAEMEDVAVIDDDLIAQCLAEEDMQDGKKDKMRSSTLPTLILEAKSLKLSFKNIRKIDNLQGFRSLTRLCLDNNIIKEINNLDHLESLEWLDLSFNNIEKIEGLDKLHKLTDLSLFSNRIESVEGLDNCINLQCLSIGNNRIKVLESVYKLRSFQQLRLLNLEGNPVCKEAEYRMTVLAYLNKLKYLDYAMVQKNEIVAAREQYQTDLIEIEKNESIDRENEELQQKAALITKELTSANLQIIEKLFLDMFKDDMEMAKLKFLPGIQHYIDQFRTNFDTSSEMYKINGLEKFNLKNEQINDFNGTIKVLRDQDTNEQTKMVEDFLRNKKRILTKYRDENEKNESDMDVAALLSGLFEQLDQLWDALMNLEVQQVEQFEDLVNEFENRYGELKVVCLDLQQSYYRQIEEYENLFNASLVQYANELLDKNANDELPDDLPEEAQNLLLDKDSLMELINGSHENRVGILLKMEDESRASEESSFSSLCNGARDQAREHNRKRVMELHSFIDKNKKQLTDILEKSVETDDYDDNYG